MHLSRQMRPLSLRLHQLRKISSTRRDSFSETTSKPPPTTNVVPSTSSSDAATAKSEALGYIAAHDDIALATLSRHLESITSKSRTLVSVTEDLQTSALNTRILPEIPAYKPRFWVEKPSILLEELWPHLEKAAEKVTLNVKDLQHVNYPFDEDEEGGDKERGRDVLANEEHQGRDSKFLEAQEAAEAARLKLALKTIIKDIRQYKEENGYHSEDGWRGVQAFKQKRGIARRAEEERGGTRSVVAQEDGTFRWTAGGTEVDESASEIGSRNVEKKSSPSPTTAMMTAESVAEKKNEQERNAPAKKRIPSLLELQHNLEKGINAKK